MIIFKSIGHFFARFFTAAVRELPRVIATAGTVEAVTASIPVYGPLAVSAEKLAYAVLGEISSVLNAAGEAGKAKLADAGLDINVIKSVEALVASFPEISKFVKSLENSANRT